MRTWLYTRWIHLGAAAAANGTLEAAAGAQLAMCTHFPPPPDGVAFGPLGA